jgi:hypothetical protein
MGGTDKVLEQARSMSLLPAEEAASGAGQASTGEMPMDAFA